MAPGKNGKSKQKEINGSDDGRDNEGGRGVRGGRDHEGGRGNRGGRDHEGGRGNRGGRDHEGGRGNRGGRDSRGGRGNRGGRDHEGGRGNRGGRDSRGGRGNRGGRDHEGGRGNENNAEPQYRGMNVNENLGVDDRVLKFCKSLGSTPFLITKQNTELWETAFELSSISPSLRSHIPKLLNSYLKFPDQSGYAPKPDTVLKLLCNYLPQCRKCEDAELVHDIVKERLCRSSSMSRIVNTDSIQSLIRQLSSLAENWTKNMFQHPGSDFQRLITFAQQFRDTFMVYESSVLRHVIEDAKEDTSILDSVQQWALSPTIGWLMNGSLYEKISLKKSYNNAEDYVETVRKVWTMLTFYWGSAAFWPKCGCQSQTGVGDARACGTPLLTYIPHGGITCTKRCGRPAMWRCMRRDHDAICQKCLLIRQANFLGPSSPNASTDIYDGTISSIQLNGDAHVIHLKEIRSRRPPKEKVNWKTSYRLQPSMLVGIVHLHGRNLDLHPSMKIYWGEIILKNKQNSREEYQQRENSFLSVRLLSRSDCPDLVSVHDNKFTRDSYVAVIDMRVFVPEVMTVLSTLGQQSFLDGFTRVAFSKYLLEPNFHETSLDLQITSLSSTLYEQLELAFNRTSIDCIAKFSVERKRSVLQKICDLQVVKTLDQTQREAFINALLRPLHCTQGPPGTGKSYVGVCLVLALIIIRQAIQSSGFPVGPILALSYKNHAIDEFLVDVLKNNSNLNTRGKLIRLGKPENELLVDCTEKKSALETKAHRELESRLSLLKKAYGKLQRWILSRDIAVQVNESDIAECLMICFHHLSRENLEQESEQKSEQDSDDYSDSNYDQIIEMNFEHLRSLLSDCENLSLEKVIPLICGGVEHWRMSDERPRSLQLLKHWIQGDVPPPRCQAFITEDLQCNESTQSNADSYCERYHSCLSQNCMRMRSPRSPRYCDLHSCAKVYCENMHYPTIPYCIAHSCYVCLQSEREVGFVCKEHSCNINGCTNSVVGDFRFCIDHCCLTCVELQIVSETSGVTQGSKYCSLHRCIYPGCVCKVVFENGLCQQHSCQYCDEQVTIGSKYCQSHTCNLEDCFECIALTESGQLSIFCQLHTCKYCALNECDLNRAVSLTTYTCYEHQLCCFIYDDGKECSNLVANGSTYCETHQNLDKISGGEFCSAITKKGKPCRSKRPDDCLLPFYFCKDHIKQAPNMTNAPVKATNDKVSVSYVSLPPVHHYWQSRVVKTAQIRRCSQQECSVWCYQVASSNKELYCKLHSLLLQVQPTVNVLKVNPSPPPAVNIPPIATPDRSLLLSNFSFEECKTDQPLDNDLIEDEKVTSSNLDEMQWEGDEFGQDDDIPTQTKHFEEIYQEEHDETTDIEFAQNHVALQDIDDLDISECIEDLKACSVWKWDMSTVERQQGVFKMVTAVCAIVTDLIHYAEEYVDEARKLKAEASAYILKEASVIGSTVVGAARRLAALRAAEPFAIIVEEACEVMEPTLVAVLAVESVKKLELIGDHRQLPAFVNQCWYNLECSIPSIKTSLFERIIMSENDHGVIIQRKDNICSILDMQRRMRTSISNLTKGEYQDLIAIQDHPATQKQKIGDKLSVAPPYRKFWIDGGRSVPGFQSCVYFWNMENNSQSRPIAGLSACNENEGLAVVELVKYLQLCGVPGQCITVITPYDGQKRLLIQLLRKNNCLPRDRADNTIHVSTVDRYQGDENDIVILSLVRTRPGNRFVGLLNRFIVATSRARLGFFIVGSISAVVHNNEGPRHWKTFIDHLSHPDTSGCDHFQSSRVGSSIPICCPVHHESTANVSSIKEARVFPSLTIWNNFCKVKCLAPLDCGHHCQLPCHLPELDKHTSECKFLIPRPCPEHSNIPLFCHTIQRKKGQSLENALRSWKCDHLDILQLPCGHEVELPCNVIQDIINTRKYPRCDVIVEDFIFSRCGHTIPNPKCYQRQQYLVDPPQCKVKVNVKRRCGHEKKLKCYQNDGSYCESIPCEIVVHTKRPRCKHPFNINCQDYQELIISLDGGYDDVRVVNGVTIVDELGEYGPSESSVLNHLDPCHVEVAFRRLCGHTMKIKCDKAFSLAGADNLPCADPTQVKCLLCRGNITIPCRYVEEYLHYLGNFDGVIESVKESNILETFESKISITRLQNPTLIDLLKKAKCTSKVLVHRSCHPSHNMELSCSDILRIFIIRDKVLQNCTSPYPLSLDCGHSIDVNCSKRNGPPPLCRRPNFEEFRYPNCEHAFIPKTCGDMRRLRNDPNLKCTREVSCLLPRCHHTTTVQCCDVSSMGSTSGGNCLPVDSNVVIASEVYCQPCEIAPVCYVPVTFQFDCGHQVDQIPCYEAFDWTNDPSKAPLCATSVSWCNPLCGHEILVTCGKISTLSTWNPWLGREKPVYPQMTLGEALVEVISYPPTVRNTDPIALNCGVKCNASVAICFEKCEHVRLVQCHELYDPQITLKCSEIVEINCPNCNLPRKLPCHDIQNQSSEEINLTCKNKCNKICQVCNITSLTVPCNQQEVSCKKDVECTLNCGHIAKWKCGKDDDPRLSYDTNTMISLQCKVCATSRWKMDDDLELDLSCMLDTCRKMFSHVAKVNDVCTILDETVLVDLSPDSTSLMNHERARHQLISKLNDAILKGDSKVIFPSQYGDMEGYIRSNYRLVYLPIPLANNPPADQLRNRCRPDSTPYGKGKMINVFDSGSLSQTVSLVNGQGKLCLGLAFQAKVLRDTPPFVINNGSKELNQQANKSSLQYMKQGYDAVEILKDNSTEMVYWNHESILPLLTLKIQLRTCCPICGDYFARSSDDGVVCPNSHFQCFECFRNYLEAAKQPDAINTYINDTGEVTCPECRSGYSLYQLNCEKCPQDIFQTLHNILLDHKLRKNEALIRQEAENKMKEELERIQKMSEEDREVHIHREQIISEILTPKCPRPQCRQAFLDFDGCFALTCGNQQCQCGFCAWCFKDCGTDAHGHVANCPYGIIDGRQLSVYGDISQLRKVWNRIRKEKIRRQLSNVSQRIRTKILQSLEKEFRDIGLKMD